MKLWVRELYLERFGHVLGEELPPAPYPAGVEDQEEAARIFGEQLYWEDYWDRNADAQGPKSRSRKPGQPVVNTPALEFRNPAETSDDDVPF